MTDGRRKQRDFAQDVAEAFRRRTKAITRRGAKVECVPVKEIVDGQESDIGRVDLGIAYRISGSPVQLRVHVWGDRWVWVDCRSGSKSGWLWTHTAEGRFVSSKGPRGVIERLEKTIDATWSAPQDVVKSVADIWSKCLATGPRRL